MKDDLSTDAAAVPGSGGGPAAAPEAPAYPADALVAVQAGLIFVTTGPWACTELGADLDQVTLTPSVAWRITQALRECLQHPGLGERRIAIDVWNASEAVAMFVVLDPTVSEPQTLRGMAALDAVLARPYTPAAASQRELRQRIEILAKALPHAKVLALPAKWRPADQLATYVLEQLTAQ